MIDPARSLFTACYVVGLAVLSTMCIDGQLHSATFAWFALVFPVAAWVGMAMRGKTTRPDPIVDARLARYHPLLREQGLTLIDGTGAALGTDRRSRRLRLGRNLEAILLSGGISTILCLSWCAAFGGRPTMAELSRDVLGVPLVLPSSIVAVLYSVVSNLPSQGLLDHRTGMATTLGVLSYVAYLAFATKALKLSMHSACVGACVLLLSTFLVVANAILPVEDYTGRVCPALDSVFQASPSMTGPELAAFDKLHCELPDSFNDATLVRKQH